jgi:hypothetical protein
MDPSSSRLGEIDPKSTSLGERTSAAHLSNVVDVCARGHGRQAAAADEDP